MRNPAHLIRSRHAIYYFRWPLPKSVHPGRRASTLKHSLNTREPLEALRLARYLGPIAETVTTWGIASGMRYDEIRKALKGHFTKLLETEKAKIAEHGRLALTDLHALQNGAALAQEAIETDGPLSLARDDGLTLDKFISLYSLPIKRPSQDYEKLGSDFKRAYRDYCRAVLAYDQSLDGFELGQIELSTNSAAANSRPAITLKNAADGFLRDRKKGAVWRAKTELERNKHLELLYEIFGEEYDIRAFGAEETLKLKQILDQYPKNRNKDARSRGLPLDEALKIKGIATISATTIAKYMQTYIGLFGWAEENVVIEKSPLKRAALRINRKAASKKRMPFEKEHVQMMLRELTTNSLGLIKKAHQKWGSLIALYSGARQNEICQIHVADVRESKGIWCFDLNDDDEGKRLKTEASRRLVPIHPKLIDFGFFDYVEQMRSSQTDRLFPELTFDKNNGWGRNLSYWFNNVFLVKLGIKSPQLVFHSFRHTVATELEYAAVQEPLIKAIIGHAQEGVLQEHYFAKGFAEQQMLDALKKLPY